MFAAMETLLVVIAHRTSLLAVSMQENPRKSPMDPPTAETMVFRS